MNWEQLVVSVCVVCGLMVAVAAALCLTVLMVSGTLGAIA